MTEPAPETPTADTPQPWASRQDVITTLGNLGPRIAASSSVDLDAQLEAGHAEARSRLSAIYVKHGLPTFQGPALEVLRWAVAKLTAASVLDILRASLDTASEIPQRLRASALEDLGRPLPGYPAGAELDEDGQPKPPAPVTGPRLGYDAPGSMFPDPYPWAW